MPISICGGNSHVNGGRHDTGVRSLQGGISSGGRSKDTLLFLYIKWRYTYSSQMDGQCTRSGTISQRGTVRAIKDRKSLTAWRRQYWKSAWEKHCNRTEMVIFQQLWFSSIYDCVHTTCSIVVGLRTRSRVLPRFRAIVLLWIWRSHFHFKDKLIMDRIYFGGSRLYFSGKGLLLIIHGNMMIFKCNLTTWKRDSNGCSFPSTPFICHHPLNKVFWRPHVADCVSCYNLQFGS